MFFIFDIVEIVEGCFVFWLSIFFVVGLFYRAEFIIEVFFLKSAAGG